MVMIPVAGSVCWDRLSSGTNPGMTDRQYIAHVDAWARLIVPGKQSMPSKLPPILERLGMSRSSWTDLLRTYWIALSGTAIGCPTAIEAEAARQNGRWVRNPPRSSPG
jgi:hypothetical protein